MVAFVEIHAEVIGHGCDITINAIKPMDTRKEVQQNVIESVVTKLLKDETTLDSHLFPYTKQAALLDSAVKSDLTHLANYDTNRADLKEEELRSAYSHLQSTSHELSRIQRA